ncbi:hypothetical protein [Tautonia sociabilis]|nr:hypothetical protein [Tautonia sociabilis]
MIWERLLIGLGALLIVAVPVLLAAVAFWMRRTRTRQQRRD